MTEGCRLDTPGQHLKSAAAPLAQPAALPIQEIDTVLARFAHQFAQLRRRQRADARQRAHTDANQFLVLPAAPADVVSLLPRLDTNDAVVVVDRDGSDVLVVVRLHRTRVVIRDDVDQSVDRDHRRGERLVAAVLRHALARRSERVDHVAIALTELDPVQWTFGRAGTIDLGHAAGQNAGCDDTADCLPHARFHGFAGSSSWVSAISFLPMSGETSVR